MHMEKIFSYGHILCRCVSCFFVFFDILGLCKPTRDFLNDYFTPFNGNEKSNV